jgi:uncharacterized Tic20 family protein
MAFTQTPLLFLFGALTILMLSLEVQAITGTGIASIATVNGTLYVYPFFFSPCLFF